MYLLALLSALDQTHNTFHVSMLQKYIADISHVSCYATLQLKEDSTYEEVPAQVMDRKDLVLHNNTIPLMKVLWRNQSSKEISIWYFNFF